MWNSCKRAIMRVWRIFILPPLNERYPTPELLAAYKKRTANIGDNIHGA